MQRALASGGFDDLRARDIRFLQEADEDSEGPASFVVVDPDGNEILVDQHR